MARKASSSRSNSSTYRVAGPDLKGLLLVLICLVILVALLGIAPGAINTLIADTLRRLFGWGAYPLTLLLGYAGVLVLLRRQWRGANQWGRALALELLILALLGLSTLLLDPTLSPEIAASGEAGGMVGWAVARVAALLGRAGGIVLLALITLALLVPVVGLPLERLVRWIDRRREGAIARRDRLMIAPPVPTRALPKPPTPRRPRRARQKAAAQPPADRSATPAPEKSPAAPLLERVRKGVSEVTEKARPIRRASGTPAKESVRVVPNPPTHYPLPPLELLRHGMKSGIDPGVAREKARVIEETLKSFGVPAQVVQVNQGPAVTQFGVQPGFIERTQRDGTVKRIKVKVSKITSLADDLALALAAKSIRVEAPVPGRPYIGIEVPNSDTELVTLHSVLTSDEFKQIRSPLAFALGRDVSGHPIAADLARLPHLLIAGATGSGKSVCVNTIISSLLFNNRPDELKMLMIDPKMVELIPYNGIPHLIAPVVTEMERVVGALTWAMREMDRRYKLFSAAGKRNIDSYNAAAESRGEEKLPFIVIVIDELADLMMIAADQVERIVCRIAQMARATGIHLILATQRPSVDVVTGLIKANIPARIAFAVASQIDSRVILDTNGAEALLGSGDMLYQSPDSSQMLRLQGCFVSEQELSEIVQHWLRYGDPKQRRAPQQADAPWDDLVEASDDAPQEDELLDRAIELVREHQWASTSFLQRKLRIGYTRAARMIDALEARGIIGPPQENNSGSREVLLAESSGKE